jgi:hypothetical protein
MSSFEFVFSLLVILLGLGLAQVLGGLASAVKRRPALSVGWGSGLLAAWVMSETVIFWQIIWRARRTSRHEHLAVCRLRRHRPLLFRGGDGVPG